MNGVKEFYRETANNCFLIAFKNRKREIMSLNEENNFIEEEKNRDDFGRFLKGHGCPGPGRPASVPSKASAKMAMLKNELLDAALESDLKEKFKQMLKSPLKFEKALKILLSISSKVRYEMAQDNAGKKSLKVTREEGD